MKESCLNCLYQNVDIELNFNNIPCCVCLKSSDYFYWRYTKPKKHKINENIYEIDKIDNI